MGGIISSIEPGGIAEDLLWRVGDEIVRINGHELSDVIDFRFYSADEFLTVEVRRGDETYEYEIEKDYDLPLGVSFQDILFDGVRSCGAHCIFCFVEQLPKGLRKSLYLKDDDFRLSFLHGNFVTLANVSDDDLRRIVTQRLSPLYISVHTTDPGLRQTMLGRTGPDILSQIDALARGHISLQTQIVLCRGVNDGPYIDQTVSDLASRYPTVESIAIVPVGLSKHRRNQTPIGSIDPGYSRELLAKVRRWQKQFLAEKGTRLVWAADEFYLNAGERVPKAAAYEGFPQIENGVGLVRKFMDSAYRAKSLLVRMRDGEWGMRNACEAALTVSVVTGVSAAPILKKWAESVEREGLRINVFPIVNELFGEMVTVAGLMVGKDIIEHLRGKDLGDVVFVPKVALRDGAFLDDVTVDDLREALGRPVLPVDPLPYPLVRRILEFAAHPDQVDDGL